MRRKLAINVSYTFLILCLIGIFKANYIEKPIICVDFGNLKTIVSVILSNGTIAYIPFEDGELSFSSQIAYGNNEFFFGKSALNLTNNDSNNEKYSFFNLKDLSQKLNKYQLKNNNESLNDLKAIHKNLIRNNSKFYFELNSYKNNSSIDHITYDKNNDNTTNDNIYFNKSNDFKEKRNSTKHLFLWEELTSLFFKQIKKHAEKFLGIKVKNAIFTVPYHFKENQRSQIKAACDLAGLNLLRILDESIAAIHTHGLHESSKEINTIVFKLNKNNFEIDYLIIDSGVPEIMHNINDENLSTEKTNKEILQKILNYTNLILQEYNLKNNNIQHILIIGDKLLTPKLQTFLKEFFPKSIFNIHFNPEKTVAYGAAYYSGILLRYEEDFLSCGADYYPLNVGFEAENGLLNVVVKKNLVIPLMKKKVFKTQFDFQDKFELKIYEGARPFIRYNRFLGSLVLDNLPKKKAGEIIIETIWKIDENAVLTVKATEVGNSKNAEVKFYPDWAPTKEQLDYMLNEAELYKKKDEIEMHNIKDIKG